MLGRCFSGMTAVTEQRVIGRKVFRWEKELIKDERHLYKFLRTEA